MKTSPTFRIGFLVSLMSLVFVVPCSVFGQNKNQSEGQPLQVLLDEVRLLRQALQNTNLFAYRGQIIVERLRIQRDRVDKFSGMIESVRTEIKELEPQAPQLQERLKEVDEKIERESTDSKQRRELENESKSVKLALSQQEQRQAELRNRESQLTLVVREEQAKLEELDKRLEALERELERYTDNDKPKDRVQKDN